MGDPVTSLSAQEAMLSWSSCSGTGEWQKQTPELLCAQCPDIWVRWMDGQRPWEGGGLRRSVGQAGR